MILEITIGIELLFNTGMDSLLEVWLTTSSAYADTLFPLFAIFLGELLRNHLRRSLTNYGESTAQFS